MQRVGAEHQPPSDAGTRTCPISAEVSKVADPLERNPPVGGDDGRASSVWGDGHEEPASGRTVEPHRRLAGRDGRLVPVVEVVHCRPDRDVHRHRLAFQLPPHQVRPIGLRVDLDKSDGGLASCGT